MDWNGMKWPYRANLLQELQWIWDDFSTEKHTLPLREQILSFKSTILGSGRFVGWLVLGLTVL